MTENEWAVMNVLWSGESFSLGEIVDELKPITAWSRNTVFTYLTRMEKKGLVLIDRETDKPYASAIRREACEKNERDELLNKVYRGATGNLIAAFLKESAISGSERERLKKMLDEMEV